MRKVCLSVAPTIGPADRKMRGRIQKCLGLIYGSSFPGGLFFFSLQILISFYSNVWVGLAHWANMQKFSRIRTEYDDKVCHVQEIFT